MRFSLQTLRAVLPAFREAVILGGIALNGKSYGSRGPISTGLFAPSSSVEMRQGVNNNLNSRRKNPIEIRPQG